MKDNVKLAKWLNDEMDGEELQDFTASAEFETYNKIKHYSAQLTTPELDVDSLYNNITTKRGRKNKVSTLSPWFTRIAAILVIALGITFYFYSTNTTMQMADAGKRTEFLLPDNSTVVLNSGSSATYKTYNWDNNRNVALTGEAFFKVAKGKKFDVTTPLGKVTVVGTQFNVKSRNNRLDVTCFEGRVKVDNTKEVILLTPGKSVAFENGESINVPDAATPQPGWLTYETSFVREKQVNVLAEIERQYNVSIEVKSKVAAKPFTGTIPMKDLTSAIQIIESVYQLKSTKSGNKIILSSE